LTRRFADEGGPDLEPAWAMDLYFGLPVLVLAAVGRSRALLVAAALFVLLALGRHTPVWGAFRLLVPPERLVRYPETALYGALVFVCALAGVGYGRRGVVRAGLVAAAALALLVSVAAVARAPFALDGGLRALLMTVLFALAAWRPRLHAAAAIVIVVDLLAHGYDLQPHVPRAVASRLPPLLPPGGGRLYRPRQLQPTPQGPELADRA